MSGGWPAKLELLRGAAVVPLADAPDGDGEASARVESQEPDERLVDLMVGYQRGSLSSFEQLYSSLAAPILRLLNEAVDHPLRAEELLDETFLQIHACRHTYRAPRPVDGWARGVASYVLRRRGIRTE